MKGTFLIRLKLISSLLRTIMLSGDMFISGLTGKMLCMKTFVFGDVILMQVRIES